MSLAQPETWQITKPARTSRGGIVVSQHVLASKAGAAVLEAGGNAVDAAVATAFALGVVEPWMSGIGGIGYLLYAEAKTGKVSVVDFGPQAPRRLDPGRYRLLDGAPQRPGGFNWPATAGDRHHHGYEAAVIPGSVDGLGLALERFGTKSLAEAMAPALTLVERGLPRDWHSMMAISLSAAELAQDPGAAATYLPGRLPPVPPVDDRPGYLALPALAATYRRLAEAGRRDFYEGELAARIVQDLQDGGSVIDAADLAGFHAEITEPLRYDYHGVTLNFAGGLTGAPTVIAALEEIARRIPGIPLGHPDGEIFVAYAEALSLARRNRLLALGAEPPQGNTTHLSVVDRDGNMVALTNTLLDRFGAKVVLPQTGITLNNGINWFDPVPGRPNSLGPGKKPLCNMCPVIADRDGEPWFALGACGGRRIISAVTQLSALLIDFSMSLDRAFATPRLDASGEIVVADEAMPADALAVLSRFVSIETAPNTLYPSRFAVASAVMRSPGNGLNTGMAHIVSPVAAAVPEGESGYGAPPP
ncbi:MAG: gamma-glutamyltransferase [Aliidongia sp.]